MARIKNLKIVVKYGNTDYVVNDLGENKSPRFELYNTKDKKSIKKSNNPLDFDNYVLNIINQKKK